MTDQSNPSDQSNPISWYSARCLLKGLTYKQIGCPPVPLPVFVFLIFVDFSELENIVLISWRFLNMLENFWRSLDFCVFFVARTEKWHITFKSIDEFILGAAGEVRFLVKVFIVFSLRFLLSSIYCTSSIC